jgi:hypothetical protein
MFLLSDLQVVVDVTAKRTSSLLECYLIAFAGVVVGYYKVRVTVGVSLTRWPGCHAGLTDCARVPFAGVALQRLHPREHG